MIETKDQVQFKPVLGSPIILTSKLLIFNHEEIDLRTKKNSSVKPFSENIQITKFFLMINEN